MLVVQDRLVRATVGIVLGLALVVSSVGIGAVAGSAISPSASDSGVSELTDSAPAQVTAAVVTSAPAACFWGVIFNCPSGLTTVGAMAYCEKQEDTTWVGGINGECKMIA